MSDDESPPRKVYWAGRQWCVTDYGLETIKEHEYYLDVQRLSDRTEGNPDDEPPEIETIRHLAEKGWVDIEDLFAAYIIAAHVHGIGVPKGSLLLTMTRARRTRWGDKAYGRIRREEREASGDKHRFDVMSITDMSRIADKAEAELHQHIEDGADFRLIADPQHPPVVTELDDDDDD